MNGDAAQVLAVNYYSTTTRCWKCEASVDAITTAWGQLQRTCSQVVFYIKSKSQVVLKFYLTDAHHKTHTETRIHCIQYIQGDFLNWYPPKKLKYIDR